MGTNIDDTVYFLQVRDLPHHLSRMLRSFYIKVIAFHSEGR
jgi:hypothetical protein